VILQDDQSLAESSNIWMILEAAKLMSKDGFCKKRADEEKYMSIEQLLKFERNCCFQRVVEPEKWLKYYKEDIWINIKSINDESIS